jgi:hypothetical protein
MKANQILGASGLHEALCLVANRSQQARSIKAIAMHAAVWDSTVCGAPKRLVGFHILSQTDRVC